MDGEMMGMGEEEEGWWMRRGRTGGDGAWEDEGMREEGRQGGVV